MDQTLTIRAEAVYEGHPQVSHFITGVESSKPLAEDALSESLSKLRRVIEELKKHGYKEEDITILDQKIINESGGIAALGRGAGFKVPIRLSARTKDFPHDTSEVVMKHFASLADAIARCGADMWGRPDFAAFTVNSSCVLFSFENFDSIEAKLLEQAISDARSKADKVAKSIGKEITELIAIKAAYPDVGIKGTPGLARERPERLRAGGMLVTVKGPILDGYWQAVCKLSIAATFRWV